MKKSGRRSSNGPDLITDEPSSLSEVDQLLRAAEDQLLLNLRVDSHTKSQNPFSSSSSNLDSDLARRFDALKSKQTASTDGEKKKKKDGEESSGILRDDLAARFAALKGSPQAPPDLALQQDSDRVKFSNDGSDDDGDGNGISEKEVEKLMQWAVDAARLHPSKSSDDNDDDDIDEKDDDDDDLEEEEKNKGKGKGRGKPKKWFFF